MMRATSPRHGLARILSKRGLCSRSEAERLIRAGRVQLDGEVVRDPRYPADPERAVIVLDANNVVRYTELVSEIKNEPNYDAALAALKAC